LELSAILEETRTIPVDIGVGAVQITYRTRCTSSAYRAGLADTSSDEMLAENLTNWEFTDNGAPVPVSLEAVQSLPEFAIISIWRAIQEDQLPNRRASAAIAPTS